MPIVQKFQKVDDIYIFDATQAQFSNRNIYNSSYLDILAQLETDHFWFTARGNLLAKTFKEYVHKSSRILEIGGGTGYIAAKLQSLGYTVEMGDIHFNALSYAKKKGIKTLYQFDLLAPPFANEFDVIFLLDVLEHIPQPIEAIRCLKQMLKPNGIIILTVPAHQSLWSREDVIAGHNKRYSKKELKQLFLGFGLHPIKVQYFFLSILPFLWIRKWIHRDDRSPLKPAETFTVKINPFFNWMCKRLTTLEASLDRLIPNIMGGSLLGIFKKVDNCPNDIVDIGQR